MVHLIPCPLTHQIKFAPSSVLNLIQIQFNKYGYWVRWQRDYRCWQSPCSRPVLSSPGWSSEIPLFSRPASALDNPKDKAGFSWMAWHRVTFDRNRRETGFSLFNSYFLIMFLTFYVFKWLSICRFTTCWEREHHEIATWFELATLE